MNDETTLAMREARRILNDVERERLAIWDQVREQVMAALKDRKADFTVTLPVLEWLSWIDEVQDRPARNMSRLIRDDLIEQLGLATERLHQELNFIITLGPALSVAKRHDRTEKS